MKLSTKTPILLPTLLAVLLFGGCFSTALHLNIRFAEISGLTKNDGVFFASNKIGEVTNVTYTDQGDYLVEVAINQEFTNAATVDSKFYVGFAPDDKTRRAVIVIQEMAGGAVLAEDSTVQGSALPGALGEIITGLRQKAQEAENKLRQSLEQMQQKLQDGSQQLDSELTNTIEELSRRMEIFQQEMAKIPESEEVQQLEQAVKNFAQAFQRSKENVQRQLQEDFLPQLQQELDQLRRQLEKEGRQEELQEIDRQIHDIETV